MKNLETGSGEGAEFKPGRRSVLKKLSLSGLGLLIFGGCGEPILGAVFDPDADPRDGSGTGPDAGTGLDADASPDTDPDTGAQPDDHPQADIDEIQITLNVQLKNVLNSTVPCGARNVQLFTIVAEASGGDVNVSEFALVCGGVHVTDNVQISSHEVKDGYLHVAPFAGSGDYFAIPEASGGHAFTIFADFSSENCTTGEFSLSLENAEDVIIHSPDDVEVIGDFPMESHIGISSVEVGKVIVVEEEPEQNVVNVGAKNVELFKAQLSGHGEDMEMKGITIENDGTASFEDFASLRLELGDDIVIEPVYVDANKISFSFDPPINVAKHENMEIKLLGDADNVIDNEFLDISLTDVYAKGDIYGFYSYPDINSENTKITFVDPQN